MKLFRIFILAVLVTTLIACGGAEERKAVYFEKAQKSYDLGDLDKARIEIKNVIQIDPKDANAIYFLGKIFEQQKDYRKAFSNYRKAAELDPDNLKNQAKLGRFYLLLANNLDKAQEKIDYILLKEPDNAEGLLLKATMYLKKKNKSKAIKLAESVVGKNPGHVEGAVLLASLYVNNDKIKQAIDVLNRALKINQDNMQLSQLLALIFVENKEFDQAESLYKKFLENDPDDASSYNNLAAFYNKIGSADKAISTLRSSIENDPNDEDRQISLIKFLSAKKGNEVAIKELRDYIKKSSGLGGLRTALGELLYVNGNKKQAIDVYTKAITDFPDEGTGVRARIALATIYLIDKKIKKANEVVNDALLAAPNDPQVNLLRAKLALYNKDVENAILALRVVTKETPENIDAFLLLVKAYQLENNVEQVRETLNVAYESNRNAPAALLKLAKYYLSSDIGEAEKIIDAYNNIKTDDYEGLSIKAAILNQNKHYQEAYKVSKKLIRIYQDKPNGYLQSIPFYGQTGDKGKAISTLKNGYINSKDNRKILALLTSLQVSEKQFDVVEKRLKAEIKKSPDDDQLKILLAKVYIASDSSDSAQALLNDAIKIKPDAEDLYLYLSKIYQDKNNAELARTTLVNGMANMPLSKKIALKLAAFYELDSEYQKAINVYRNVYKVYPDNMIVINNLASLLSDHSQGESDHELMRSLSKKLEANGKAVFLDTVGWVSYKLGDYQAAVRNLTKVVEESPDINVFNYHLGMAYKMSGDKANAKVYLEKSLANGKKFREQDLAMAALKNL